MFQLVPSLTMFLFIYEPFLVPLDVFTLSKFFANNVTNSPNDAVVFIAV